MYTYKMLICCLLLINLQTHSKEFLIHKGYRGPGLGALFCSVLGLLHYYDQHMIAGLKVDFNKDNLYYDFNRGSNWWEYYFEPLFLGNQLAPTRVIELREISEFLGLALCQLPAKRCNELIKKYIRIKPHIIHKVNNFYLNNLRNKFVIGVHYRGTDKKFEVKRTEYNTVYSEIMSIIKKNKLVNYKIFIATDEQAFLDYIKTKCTNVVYTNAHRSINGQPLHLTVDGQSIHYTVIKENIIERGSPYIIGEECVIDMLLLAKSNILIRTASCVNACAQFFNPNMEVLSLSTQSLSCLRAAQKYKIE